MWFVSRNQVTSKFASPVQLASFFHATPDTVRWRGMWAVSRALVRDLTTFVSPFPSSWLSLMLNIKMSRITSSHVLNSTWWGCYGLCLTNHQPSLPTLFYSFLASICVFMALSTVFRSINSSDNFPFIDSVLPVLSLPYWFFQLYVSLWKSPSAPI